MTDIDISRNADKVSMPANLFHVASALRQYRVLLHMLLKSNHPLTIEFDHFCVAWTQDEADLDELRESTLYFAALVIRWLPFIPAQYLPRPAPIPPPERERASPGPPLAPRERPTETRANTGQHAQQQQVRTRQAHRLRNNRSATRLTTADLHLSATWVFRSPTSCKQIRATRLQRMRIMYRYVASTTYGARARTAANVLRTTSRRPRKKPQRSWIGVYRASPTLMPPGPRE
jgi:hypothetical protein